jgi:excisionase family DNA binding protein
MGQRLAIPQEAIIDLKRSRTVPRTRPIFPIALSIQAASDALDVPRASIEQAVSNGELPAHAGPGRRVRILVADITEWIRRTWPRARRR